MTARELIWRKSSYSGPQGDCVEIGWASPSDLVVRDAKNPDGPALSFPAVNWRTFVTR